MRSSLNRLYDTTKEAAVRSLNNTEFSGKLPKLKVKHYPCMGCAGRGYVMKMPEQQYKACRLCDGTGEART